MHNVTNENNSDNNTTLDVSDKMLYLYNMYKSSLVFFGTYLDYEF